MTKPVKKSADNLPGPGPGRPAGVPNKTTTKLKEAILAAAEEVGEDGQGKGGLQGYLVTVAKEDIKAFTALLGKVLPMQVTGEDGGNIVTEIVIRGVTANR